MATGPTDTGKRGRLISWLEERLPIRLFIDTQLTGYFAPSNFNVWYYFGVLALVLLVVQFATGVFLAMFYKPAEAAAFDSVQYIMREVEWGWLLEAENFEPADPLSTPEHIAPVWYFTPYYAILRAIPDQRLGALLMLLAVASFLFLPWLDRSRVRSMRHKGWLSRIALAAFVISFIALGFLGLQAAEGAYVVLARILTVVYFAFFWLMPVYTRASLDRGWRAPAT